MSRRAVWLLLALVLLVAILLRFHAITAQSLWSDEGTSAALALRDLPTITRNAGFDIHPPLYYWLLHFWVGAWGNSELALRSLSAVLGVVTVLFVYLAGARLFGHGVGLGAGLFAAISPYLVYYSQETRMYSLLAAVGAAGTYLTVRLLEDEGDALRKGKLATGRTGWLAGSYVVVAGLGLYTHYSFPVVWAVWNATYITWLAWSWKRGRPWARLGRWTALQAAALALYAPWLPTGLRQMRQWPAISEPHSLPFFLKDALRLFVGGETLAVSLPILAIVAALALIGLLPRRGEPLRLPWWLRSGLVGALCAAPVAAQWAMSLWRPAYRPKFFLVAAPAFALLVARGALAPRSLLGRAKLGRAAGTLWAAASVLLVGSLAWTSLGDYYTNPRYARDDYRGIAAYISALGGDRDAVLINAPSQVETFTYYYKGKLPLYPLPQQRPLDRARTEADLKALVEGKERVFAVYWATNESDPERFIEGWMDSHTFKAQDNWYGNVRLVVYGVPHTEQGRPEPLDVILGDRIALEGYSLLSDEVPSGGIAQLTLYWRCLAPIDERYKVFVHLLDGSGYVISQRDAEPGGGARLTTTWQPGERIVDNYGLLVPFGIPPGRYRIEIGMYGEGTGARLAMSRNGQPAGDHVVMDRLMVVRPADLPSLEAVPITR